MNGHLKSKEGGVGVGVGEEEEGEKKKFSGEMEYFLRFHILENGGEGDCVF